MFRRVGIRLALLVGDLTVIVLALLLSSWLRPQLGFGKELPISITQLDWPVYLLALVVWAAGFILTDIYNLQKNLRAIDELQRVVAAHIVAILAFAGTLYFSYRDISRLQVLVFALTGLILLLFYRAVFRFFLYHFGDKRYGTRRVLIAGAGLGGRNAAKMVAQHSWTGLQLTGFVDDNLQADTIGYPHFGSLDQTLRIVEEYRINEVVFALPRHAHTQLANLVIALQSLRVNVRVVPDLEDLIFLRSLVEDFGGMPLIALREPAMDPLQRLIKRLFDLVISSIGLLLALPIMAIVAIVIKRDSPGPIIFKQQRVGINGRIFGMYKFRTMNHDPEAEQNGSKSIIVNGISTHKLYEDPRVTKVGRFLRRTSLDELPQFLNVLKGDMSLVGPRPELPWLVEKYKTWQRKRFEVPQGLTGWWQVNGRADKPMHLHTEEDLYYIKHYSLWLDIQILWRTVKALIDRHGAY